MATTRKPIYVAELDGEVADPRPTPSTATRSPGPALDCRSPLNAVMPPHIIGAISSKGRPSGARATACCGATRYSA